MNENITEKFNKLRPINSKVTEKLYVRKFILSPPLANNFFWGGRKYFICS